MYGHTVSTMIDGFLDELSRRDYDRRQALEALDALTLNRPELDQDDDVVTARLWLSRS